MANLFEKPIAANPISEFAALPLQFIDRSMERKQRKFDAARADMYAVKNSISGVRALANDQEGLQRRNDYYTQRIDALVDNADGDYSSIKGGMEAIKSELTQEMNNGELHAYGSNFKAAMASKAANDKLYQSGKISSAGIYGSNSSISNFKTELGDNGVYSTYSPYMASNVSDPYKALGGMVDNMNAKYTEEGMKVLSASAANREMFNYLQKSPDTEKALMEQWRYQNARLPEDKRSTYSQYRNKTVTDISSSRAYAEVDKVTGGNANTKGHTFEMQGVSAPHVSGDAGISGMSMQGLKNISDKLFDTDNSKEFLDSLGKPDARMALAYIQKKTGVAPPKDPYELMDYIQEYSESSATNNLNVQINGMTKAEKLDIISDKGVLQRTGAVFEASTGRQLKGDEIASLGGSKTTGEITKVQGRSGAGTAIPYGSVFFIDKEGRRFYQEPTDTRILNSPEFTMNEIERVKFSPVGQTSIKLNRSLKHNGTPVIPQGSYKTYFDADTGKVALVSTSDPANSYIYTKDGDSFKVEKRTKKE